MKKNVAYYLMIAGTLTGRDVSITECKLLGEFFRSNDR